MIPPALPKAMKVHLLAVVFFLVERMIGQCCSTFVVSKKYVGVFFGGDELFCYTLEFFVCPCTEDAGPVLLLGPLLFLLAHVWCPTPAVAC